MATAVKEPRQLTATIVVAASNSVETWRASWSSALGRYFQCDGTADDVEILAALNAGTGGKVVLLEGTYNTAANLTIPADTTLEGEGWGTIVNAGGAAITNAVIINGVRAAVKNMKVMLAAGAGAGGSRPNVITTNSNDYCLLDNLWIAGDESVAYDGSEDRQNGVRCPTGTDYCRIINCRIEDNKFTGIQLQLLCLYNVIEGNLINSNTSVGIYFAGTAANVTARNTIRGNIITSNGDAGMSLVAGDYLIIVDNEIYGNTQQGVKLTCCNYCSVSHNVITNSGSQGIYVTGNASKNADYNVVTSNVVQGNTGWGIALEGTIYTNKNRVADNTILGNTAGQFSDAGNATIAYRQHSDLLMDVLAVSATAIRSNEDLSAVIPITFTLDAQPDVPRTLSGHFDTHAQITAYTIVITGTDAKGKTVTETFTEAASPWDFETVNAYATITSIIMTARTGTGAGDTMDIGVTDVLGLSNTIDATSDVYKIKKNNANAVVAAAQVNITYDTYDMAVIGLAGGDDFTIYFKSSLNTITT